MAQTHQKGKAKNILVKIKKEIAKVIVGQNALIEDIAICFFAQGHCLIRGLPGLAKTTVVKAIARAFGMDFNRVQFTPDLMPSDLIGYEVLEEIKSKKQFKFIKGPVFSQILLADEINRTPPKTQSALLQAMQEREVTVMGKVHQLSLPFLVLATQNPIEQEGTYPLPEAQLDRFMFLLNVNYPGFEEEMEVVKTSGSSSDHLENIKTLFSFAELQKHLGAVEKIKVADSVYKWIVKLVHATRPDSTFASSTVKEAVSYGASPRASISIVKAAKAFAYLEGIEAVERHHIQRVALPILRHRIILNFTGEAELGSSDKLIKEILKMKL